MQAACLVKPCCCPHPQCSTGSHHLHLHPHPQELLHSPNFGSVANWAAYNLMKSKWVPGMLQLCVVKHLLLSLLPDLRPLADAYRPMHST